MPTSFLYQNWSDPYFVPTAVLSGGGAVATLPVQNLQDEQPRKVYRTIGTSAFVVLDLLAARDVDAIAAIYTSLTAAATMRARASNSDPAAVSSLVYDSNSDGGKIYSAPDQRFNGNALLIFSARQNARYWRIDFADAAVSTIDIGLLPIGPFYNASRYMSLGHARGVADLSGVEANEWGRIHVKKNPSVRVRAFALDALSEAEIEGDLEALNRIMGTKRAFLLVPDTSSAYLAANYWWGLATSVARVSKPAHRLFSWSLDFRERL